MGIRKEIVFSGMGDSRDSLESFLTLNNGSALPASLLDIVDLFVLRFDGLDEDVGD